MNDVIELPDSTSLGAIGQPLRRKEDERLLTGRGRFSDDFTVPGQTYAAVVRSPHPHARIVEIDTRRALAMPGVLGILTGQDCAADGLSPRRTNLVEQEAMPYPNAVGARYDSGTYEANMDLAMEIADWDGFVARRRAAEASGKLLGLAPEAQGTARTGARAARLLPAGARRP